MNKKQRTMMLILVIALVIGLGSITYAYWTANTENKISTNTTIQTGVLKLVLDDGTNKDGVLTGTIDPNNTKFTTYLSITNEGTYDTFAKLYFKGLINTFSNDLVYSIEQIDSIPTGNTEPKIVKRFKYQVPVPSTETSSRELLADGLLIKMGTLNGNNLTPHTQHYRVTVEYLWSDTVDQSSDLGKSFYTGFDIEQGDKLTETIVMLDNIEDLVELANEVNTGDNKSGKEYRLMRNLDFNSDDSYLDAATTKYGDINKNGTIESIKTELTTAAGWTPIGTETNPFSGTFNGQNCEISSLYIYNSDENVINVGLFGKVNSNISNIILNNALIISNINSNVGGIVGQLINGTIDNSKNVVSLNNKKIEMNNSSFLNGGGGIVGKISGNSSIRKCYNYSTVIGSSNTYFTQIGGIVGILHDISNVMIDDVSNYGTLNGVGQVGGIVGSTDKRLTNSATLIINKASNYGNINMPNNSATVAIAGGILGTNYDCCNSNNSINTFIINSVNNGIITNNSTATENGNEASGGIVGGNLNWSAKAVYLHIYNSYNKGDIYSYKAQSSGILGKNNGYSNKDVYIQIKNVYNAGDITGNWDNSGIFYRSAGTYDINNSYFKTPNTTLNTNAISASNASISATGMSLSQMQDASFVNTLNNNRSSITLPSELNGYTLSTWCTSDNGPVLDYQVPESERSTRCPAYNN